MLPTPGKFTLVAGSAEGITRLNAFDNALLTSGIGNLNLLKVSSILPPGATEAQTVDMPPGSLVPTAYGAIESDVEGEILAAAVAVGVAADGGSGVIMEFSGRCSAQEALEQVEEMTREAFRQRGRELSTIRSRATEHRVRHIGCALAAVALWY